jgi:hypothetical protein
MKEGKDLIKNMIRRYLKSYSEQKQMLYSLDDKVGYYGVKFN